MSLVLEYGLDSPARALLILSLSLKDKEGKEEMDRIHIQKTIRYFEHLQQERLVEFTNFKQGGVSYELHENLETLEECGLIERVDRNYHLTDEGKKAAYELMKKYGEEALRKLLFAKHQLNDLSYNELLYFMYKLLPETQVHSTEFPRLNRMRETLVRRLFLRGRINATTAAKWLEVDEDTFLRSLRDYRVQ